MDKKIAYAGLILSISILSIFLLCFSAATATESCTMSQLDKTKPQLDWPTSPLTQKRLDENTTIPGLVQYFFEWGVGLGGIAVFIALIIAGVEYITSVANPSKLQAAKDRIKSSLIGLVLLLSSWAIFNLINPSLNTLRDLPDISNAIVAGGIASDRTCNSDYDCCTTPNCDKTTCSNPSSPDCCVNLNCAPENFACCQRNDANCIKGQEPKKDIGAPSSAQPNGATCAGDAGCESNYCACDRTTKPWSQKCKENPKVCINIIGEPVLGCDFIAFYDKPDFSTVTPVEKEIVGSDTNWTKPLGETNIKSYQAFRYAKNKQGDYIDENGAVVTDKKMAKKVPCGTNACGCKISICIDINPGLGSCVNPTSYTLAFNENLDGQHTMVNIQDQTKGAFEQARSGLNWLWDNTIGWIFH